jgi:hypothetical protein
MTSKRGWSLIGLVTLVYAGLIIFLVWRFVRPPLSWRQVFMLVGVTFILMLSYLFITLQIGGEDAA